MNIGFYLLDINNNDQKDKNILSMINDLCVLRPYDNVVLFNNQFNAIDIDHKYYILHISEAKYFKGLLFTFDIKSAMLTKTFPCPKKQILYVDKAEWSEKTDLPYSFWYNIYMNEDFELLSSDKKMHELCQICWKEPIATISDFSSKDIDNVIQRLF